jgi:hypothetical protein
MESATNSSADAPPQVQIKRLFSERHRSEQRGSNFVPVFQPAARPPTPVGQTSFRVHAGRRLLPGLGRRTRRGRESVHRRHEQQSQVLSNLVGNAIEHGDESGAIEVLAKSEGPKVLLTVTNQGPVIASVVVSSSRGTPTGRPRLLPSSRRPSGRRSTEPAVRSDGDRR